MQKLAKKEKYMDIHICTCCGKVIDGKDYDCKTCGSHFCQNCHQSIGTHCQTCGDENF